MRRRSIAYGLVAAGMALALAAGPAMAGDRERGFAEGAAVALGAVAVAGAILHPPVVVRPAPVVVAPPALVVAPAPPPLVVVSPAPVVVYRYGPPYGHAWGHWKHHRHR